jgi:BASS family bile acid:Na+ symporter
MAELLQRTLVVATLVFTVTSMLAVGLGHTFRDVVTPLRNWPVVVRALIANFVMVPLLATLLTRAFSLDPASGLALDLLASAAGAAFLIKLTVAARGDGARSAALLLLLVPATVVYMPLAVPAMLAHPEWSGVQHASVSAAAIAKPLVLDMLLPLGVGLYLRSRGSRWAARLQPVMAKTSTFALVMLVGSASSLHGEKLASLFGTASLFAVVIFICGSLLCGYALGAPHYERSVVFALGTGQRNIAAALVVATQSVREPGTTLIVVAASVLSIVILFPIAFMFRRRRFSRPPPSGAAPAA